jgi:hypothetical protein
MEEHMHEEPTDYEEDIDYDTPALMPPGEPEALERASWHMRMAAQITAERDQIAAVYKAEMERLEMRLAHRMRIMNNRIAWHEQPVEALHLALLKSNPKRKTIELPYGTSKVRVSTAPKLSISDNSALLVWAENNHPELLGRTINITAVKTVAVMHMGKVIDAASGEMIPGVEATTVDPKWSSLYEQDEA